MLPQGWTSAIALLDGQPDADPIARAKRLCQLSVSAAGVTGATLAVVSEEHRSTVCATDAVSDGLEDLQLEFAEGPTVEAVRHGWPVLVPDLSQVSQSRWPWFASAAMEAGARAVFVFPVQVGAIRLGALSLYRDGPGELSQSQLTDARTLADAAAVLLSIGHGPDTAQAFVWAMDDRSRFRAEVHQAVGVTMAELGVDAKQAFALLRAHAFASGRPIGEVATDIIAQRLRLEPG